MTKTLPISYLHECFDVDFETGILTWRERPVSHFKDGKRSAAHNAAAWNGRFAEEAVGSSSSHGYLKAAIDNQMHLLHRVVWAMAHGEWPEDQIDHINGNRDDNRLSNLRAVSNTENGRNRTAQRNGTSRYPGVDWNKVRGKWRALITINGKQKYLGYFTNEEDAAAAYRAAARAHGFTERHLQPARGTQ